MKNNSIASGAKEVRDALRPFLDLDIVSWRGLPGMSEEELVAAFGEAEQSRAVELGCYPARLLRYVMDRASGGFDAYVRNNEVILVESLHAPVSSILRQIGDPDAVLPNEILAEDAYVHEFLYCKTGLVLSVAEPFDKGQTMKIVRCRGIRPLENPKQFGPELYIPFEDRILW